MISVLSWLHAQFTVLWFLSWYQADPGIGIPLRWPMSHTCILGCLLSCFWWWPFPWHWWKSGIAGPLWESQPVFLHAQGEVISIPVLVAIQALVLATAQTLVVATVAVIVHSGGQLLSPLTKWYLYAWQPPPGRWQGMRFGVIIQQCSLFCWGWGHHGFIIHGIK